jgi:predicted O-methyltransferase YrrM
MSIMSRRNQLLEDPQGLRGPDSMELQHIYGLMRLLPPDGSILEYGSGFSTTWLRQQLAPEQSILSVEHDPEYAKKTGAILSPYVPDDVDEETLTVGWEEYVFAPLKYGGLTEDVRFDLVIVDGVIRNACLLNITSFLKPDGFVALHDAERPTYEEGKAQARWLYGVLPFSDSMGRQLWLGKSL